MKKLTALLLLAVVLSTGCTSENTSSGNLAPNDVFNGKSDSSAPPAAMVEMTSQRLVSNIRFGWNLGHSLEAYLAPDDTESVRANETLWGNPPATSKLFESLVDSGVNAVRLPITWRDHIDEDGNIDEGWLNRVRQVTNFAYDSGMYVILTLYHDGDNGEWLANAAQDHDKVLARYVRIWEQLSDMFSSSNERIMFESMNAVDFTDVSDDESYELLNEINQLFVDTVRSAGGNNPWRHLLISGYDADIICSLDGRFKMPEDPSERLILSVHYYIPLTYCVDGIQDNWGSNTDQIWMENMINQLRTAFTDNDIPVMITEYGTAGSDLSSRVFFCEKLTKLCHDAGIATFLWDDGSEFDRTEYVWTTPGLADALNRASSSTKYTPTKQNITLPTAETENSTGE